MGVSVGVLVSLVTRAPETPEVTRDPQAPSKPASHLDRRLYSPLVHHLLPPSPTDTAAEEFKLINYVELNTKQTEEGQEVPPKYDIDKPE